MGNRARAEHIKRSKVNATGALAKLLLNRSGLSAQDLQDLFWIGEKTESDAEFAPGDFWNKAKKKNKNFSDDTLAQIAHLAVARGPIICEDTWQLQLAEGGPRILRSVLDLLVDSKCGVAHTEASISAHLDEWKAHRKQLLAMQSQERLPLEVQLDALRESIAVRSHWPPTYCRSQRAQAPIRS